MDRDVLRPNGRVLGLKICEPSDREQCQPEGFIVHVIFFCDLLCCWMIQIELFEWFISPCELIFGVIVVN